MQNQPSMHCVEVTYGQEIPLVSDSMENNKSKGKEGAHDTNIPSDIKGIAEAQSGGISAAELVLPIANTYNVGNEDIVINDNVVVSQSVDQGINERTQLVIVTEVQVDSLSITKELSPNKVLHDLVSHNVENIEENQENVVIKEDKEEKVNLVNEKDLEKTMYTTLVYAKRDETERLQLWDNLYHFYNTITGAWMIGGDFNMVLNDEEKIGGILFQPQDVKNFAFCVNSCALEEISFKGNHFTWWNCKVGDDCIFERLDRMFINDPLQDWFSSFDVEHPARTDQNQYKPFKFMMFWVDHDSFMPTVRQNWPVWEHEDLSISFKCKMKKLKGVLHQWSRLTYGDIFKQIIIRKEIFRINDGLFEEDPSPINKCVLQKFTQENLDQVDEILLDHVPVLIDEGMNEQLRKVPTMEEVKAAVFNLSGSSACGPDGFSGIFYQNYWDIVGKDVYSLVLSFFNGNSLPKSNTHTNLVLLPKKAGFVQGRSIIENFLLAEIVIDIRKRGKPANVVIKLDMAKAYDSVAWSYLIKLLGKMGFSEVFIDMIWRLLANNWYSILLNGKAKRFFNSTRGVKQGDPLSPALFILSSEVLSRALNSLAKDSSFVGYGMPKWSARINQHAYADDTIIFASAEKDYLVKIMIILKKYDETSGQLINRDKSSLYLYDKVAQHIQQEV
ncbi:uncharacterized protein LOC132644046 [Lycium barbarum]|uniref:uncharacterized protein LOC132644046 n=1 Tax=Lycium barbarum TaxID=112863 RepID=UPI00293F577B|nr:uncharacterized protein LOC132644046 [Lycium barbarum]